MPILIAKKQDERTLYLSDEMDRDQLRLLRTTTNFFCPQCHAQVILKVGNIMAPHFAHLKDTTCTASFSEGESKLHLEGKQQLFSFFQQRKLTVQLEPFMHLLSQRPDLLVRTGKGVIPIEFQCSTIPIELIESRTKGYRSAGMNPIWILNTPPKLKDLSEGVGLFHLSRFHECFLSHQPPEGHVFLTFNPTTKSFHYYSCLLHIAGNRYIGIHRTLSISNQTFPFARPKTPSIQDIKGYVDLYKKARTSFLNHCIPHNRRGVQNRFLRSCYEMQIHPTQLPLWIGVPVQFNHAFREHDCEWQMALLHLFKQRGLTLAEVTNNSLENFISSFEGDQELQMKACQAYRALLMKLNVESPLNKVHFDENDLIQLISKSFLAKRYEN